MVSRSLGQYFGFVVLTYLCNFEKAETNKINIVEGNSTIWIPLVHNADTNISLLFSSVSSYKCVQITQTFLQHPLKLGKTLVSLVDKPHKELLDCFSKLYPVHNMWTTNLEFWIYDFLDEVENRQKIPLKTTRKIESKLKIGGWHVMN